MTSASPTVSSTADLEFPGRTAPWSNDAEQAVLAAMLLDQDAALKAAELLDDAMFYKEAHRILFRAMVGLTEKGDVIDPVTLREELARRGDLDRVGGMECIEQMQGRAGALTGVASGFKDLDEMTAGFQRSDLVILAARPSMGKTAFALNVVQHAAIEHSVKVAIFSLEMSKDQLVQRLLCSEGLVDAQRLRRGALRDEDYPKLARAAGLLSSAYIWIDDSAGLTPLAMRSKARRLKAEHDIGLLVVDYLQLMQGPQDIENRQQEVSYISRSLKALAKELDVPVLALS